jgi:glutaryl-CoA dehydrogenase
VSLAPIASRAPILSREKHMQAFTELDLYAVDALYTEEERLVRDSVRRFVDDRVLPIIEEHNRAGTFPKHLVGEMAELGLLGANLQGYGCAGLGPVAYGLIMQELERGDSGLRSFVSVQGALCMWPIYRYGSEAQKQRWLPPMAAGKAIGAFGLTEPDFGSDPGGMITRARRKGDSWILNGTKFWITNGSIADVSIIWAKDDDGKVRGFLVESNRPGFGSTDIKGKFSLRASVTSEISLQDVEVPDANRLPGAEGLGAPLSCLSQARYGIAWGAVGAAQAVFNTALEYAKTRVQFGKPIAGFQLVQKKLAEMATEITKAQLLDLQLGRLKEKDQATFVQISIAKRNNVHMALEAARTARDILGANGVHDEYPVGRHLCNLESVFTYEGTHDIHTLILGEHLTGMAAYR